MVLQKQQIGQHVIIFAEIDKYIDDLCLQRSLLQILQAINILQHRSLLYNLQEEFWNSIIRLCSVRKGYWLSGRCVQSNHSLFHSVGSYFIHSASLQ